MYALCPRCSAVVEDEGHTAVVRCPECGHAIKSRARGRVEEAPPKRPSSFKIPRGPPVWQAPPEDIAPPPGPYGWRPRMRPYVRPPREKVYKKGYDIFSNVLGLLSLIFVIGICLVLTTNFMFLIAGIPVVQEGIMNDIEYLNQGEFEIIVDRTAPETDLSVAGIPGSPLLKVELDVSEKYLETLRLGVGNNSVVLPTVIGRSESSFIYYLDLEDLGASPGDMLVLEAVDRAGNLGYASAALPAPEDVEEYIVPLASNSVLGSSWIPLEIHNTTALVLATAVIEHGGESFSNEITQSGYSLNLPEEIDGDFTLTLDLKTNGTTVRSVYTYSYRDIPLKIGFPEISRTQEEIPEAYGEWLYSTAEEKDESFVPSELVVCSFESSSPLVDARAVIDKKEYHFTEENDEVYKVLFQLPDRSRKWNLAINITDENGKMLVESLSVNVKDVPAPILWIHYENVRLESFPAYVDGKDGGNLRTTVNFYRGLKEARSTITGSGLNLSQVQDLDENYVSDYFFEDPDEGDLTIYLKGYTSREPGNGFFLVLPLPPYLFHINAGLSGAAFFGYYLFLVAAVIVSLGVLLVKDLPSTLKAFYRPKIGRTLNIGFPLPWMPRLGSQNTFILLIQIFASTIFLSVATVAITALVGGDFGTPDSLSGGVPDWWLLYSLLNASVYEEITSRLLLIGVPLVIYEIISRLIFKEKVNRFLNCIFGGSLDIKGKDVYLILFSGALFGLAHFSGWSAWKVIPTFLSGVAFGYLFYKKGLHIAILLHFATDYLAIAAYFGESVFMILAVLVVGLGMLGLISFGYIYSVHYGRCMFAKLFNVKERPSWTLIRGMSVSAVILQLLTIVYLFYLGDYRVVFASILTIGLISLVAGTFFVFIKSKGLALLFLGFGALLSIVVPFLSILALIPCYDLYLQIRKGGPPWVISVSNRQDKKKPLR